MKKKRCIQLMALGLLLLTLNGCKPISGLEQNNNKEEIIEVSVVESVEEQAAEVIEEFEEVIVPFIYVQIKADALNVRKEAMVSSSILDKVYDQSVHIILEEITDTDGVIWYKIKSPKGEIGWISGDYCIGGWDVNDFESSATE